MKTSRYSMNASPYALLNMAIRIPIHKARSHSTREISPLSRTEDCSAIVRMSENYKKYLLVSRKTQPQILPLRSASTCCQHHLPHVLTCGKLTNSFISEISLSTSSMNCMMKSTNLCLSISSVWKFVMRNEMSYP